MCETQANEHRLPNLRSIQEQGPFESQHASCRLGMKKNYPASISVPIKFLCLVMWPRELVRRLPDLCYIFTTGTGGKNYNTQISMELVSAHRAFRGPV